jgi:hypothetical protein
MDARCPAGILQSEPEGRVAIHSLLAAALLVIGWCAINIGLLSVTDGCPAGFITGSVM